MNNAKYQKMTEIGDRTALRVLNDLEERSLIVKTGQLKDTCYHLNVPHLVSFQNFARLDHDARGLILVFTTGGILR
ncbi:MAG: hypothetical protein R6U56_07800 [Opitutales bacterium]